MRKEEMRKQEEEKEEMRRREEELRSRLDDIESARSAEAAGTTVAADAAKVARTNVWLTTCLNNMSKHMCKR